MNVLIYDIEIIKAVPDKKFKREEGIEYCEGWQDHSNMGISVIGAFDSITNRYRVFCKDNWNEFAGLVANCDILVSFNGLSFDNVVLGYNNIVIPVLKCYDLLVETWAAFGLGPTFKYPSHAGFGLDALCEKNFGLKKTGHGAFAPVLWQQGKIGEVIDYCLNDIALTKKLFGLAARERKYYPPNKWYIIFPKKASLKWSPLPGLSPPAL